jgi:hypothetical protein
MAPTSTKSDLKKIRKHERHTTLRMRVQAVMATLLGAFAKLRKTTISLVMSVRLSICPHGATRLPLDGFSWTFMLVDFYEHSCLRIFMNIHAGRFIVKIHAWGFFENPLSKFKIHSNRTRITGSLHEDQYTFLSYLAHFFLEWEMFQKKVVDKIKTHICCSKTGFRK